MKTLKRSINLFSVFSLLLLASSCAPVGRLTTPSTKPEVTLRNATKQRVLEALVAWSATHGRQVTATTEYSVTITGAIPARTSNNILWDETVMAKTMYTPVVKGNDITLYAQRLITYVHEEDVHSDYGSNHTIVNRTSQQVTEDHNTQRAYEELQIELENFAQYFTQNL